MTGFSKAATLVTGAALAVAIPLGAYAAQGGAGDTPDGAQSGDVAILLTALDDEYKAEATYAAVLEKFGSDVRPFVNIIRAEQRHSDMAKAELDRLGAQYPRDNPYLGTIAAPDTLLVACETGIVAEQENIALYDRLLPTVADAQVHDVLSKLQWASQDRHLPAFQRCVDRGGTMGGGWGRGQGRGWGRGG